MSEAFETLELYIERTPSFEHDCLCTVCSHTDTFVTHVEDCPDDLLVCSNCRSRMIVTVTGEIATDPTLCQGFDCDECAAACALEVNRRGILRALGLEGSDMPLAQAIEEYTKAKGEAPPDDIGDDFDVTDLEETNAYRGASMVEDALNAAFHDWSNSGNQEGQFVCFLAGMLHLCDSFGLDFEELRKRGYETYRRNLETDQRAMSGRALEMDFTFTNRRDMSTLTVRTADVASLRDAAHLLARAKSDILAFAGIEDVVKDPSEWEIVSFKEVANGPHPA